jgi:hypothetical protein
VCDYIVSRDIFYAKVQQSENLFGQLLEILQFCDQDVDIGWRRYTLHFSSSGDYPQIQY